MCRLNYPSIFAIIYDKHLKEIEKEISTNEKFKCTRLRKVFVIKHLNFYDHPYDILQYCFQKSVETTIQKSKESNIEADWIGVNISSQMLLDDICNPFRPITLSTTHEIASLFSKQIGGAIEHDIFFSEPFESTITGIGSKLLPKRRSTGCKPSS